MPSTDRGRQATLRKFRQEFVEGIRPYLVETYLAVYVRDGGGRKLDREFEDLRVLVYPDGRRLWPEDERFEEVAGECELVRIRITCHEKQVAAILSDAQIVGLLGGSRAGKSEVLAFWLLRQWLKRGPIVVDGVTRPGLYWWVGPTIKQAYKIGVKKLATIFPEALRGPMPSSYSANLTVTLVDGCLLEFHHAHSDGSNFKGEAIQAAALDEITTWKDVANYRIISDRTLDTGAPIAVGSTPMAGHWAREEIILRARDVDDVEHYEISQFDNPWISERWIWKKLQQTGALSQEQVMEIMAANDDIYARAEAAKAIITDPLVLRERFGVWTTDGLSLYSDFTIEHITKGRPSLPVGYVWLTDLAILAHFKRPDDDDEDKRDKKRVGGQDWNVNPMTTILGQVFGIPGRPKTWGLWIEDEVQTQGNVQRHALNLQRTYPRIAISCDATGALPGTHPAQGAIDSNTNAKIMREAGFDCRPCAWVPGSKGGSTPRNPSQVDSINLVCRLFKRMRLLVDVRCRMLIQGLETAQRASDGRILKVSGKKTDRLSSAPDALRYLVWRLFKNEWRKAAKSEKQAA